MTNCAFACDAEVEERLTLAEEKVWLRYCELKGFRVDTGEHVYFLFIFSLFLIVF